MEATSAMTSKYKTATHFFFPFLEGNMHEFFLSLGKGYSVVSVVRTGYVKGCPAKWEAGLISGGEVI